MMPSAQSANLSDPTPRASWRAVFGWRRLRTVGILCSLITVLFSFSWKLALWVLVARVFCVGLALLLVFGLFEQWPRRLPGWLARWVLQVAAVGATVPVAMFIAYFWSTAPGAPLFWKQADRLEGFMAFTFIGMLLAPWTALAALLRQRDATLEEQAVAMERAALDARMRLLSAQAQPHFLFNTLANVQALVETGSPRAPMLLESLTSYLRAAVPRLDGSASTLGQEIELVRAYLALMQMRMPDRLAFALHIGAGVHLLPCPPFTLLTLVENAVQHGIDPSEEGGCIDVHAELRDNSGGAARCRLSVIDTGVGLQVTGRGLGTGLAALRERLHWAYNGTATLELSEAEPHGVHVTIEFDVETR